MTRKHLVKVARLELRAWGSSLPRGLVMAILFAFIHRAVEGESFEETFCTQPPPAIDYEI